MKRIAILSMDLASECTLRCVLLAQALQGRYDVEILGLLWQRENGTVDELMPHVRNLDIPIRSVLGRRRIVPFLWTMFQLLRKLRADVVIANKPRPASFGIALLYKFLTGTPVILDVDDDEIAIRDFVAEKTGAGRRGRNPFNLGHPNGDRLTRILHRYCDRADAVICVSERFCSEYGGVIAPHGRDPDEYDPARIDGAALRRSLGFADGELVIGFIGTPRPMKGINVLLDALDMLDRSDLKLMIVGADMNEWYAEPIRDRIGGNVVAVPPVSMRKVPEYVAASDLIVLPQIDSPMTSGQMPAKLTEAMAMAKPIIASATADIPRYLEGCGILVQPEDSDELARQIAWVADHRDEARQMGQRARERFLKDMTMDYLFQVVDREIEGVFSRVNGGEPVRTGRAI